MRIARIAYIMFGVLAAATAFLFFGASLYSTAAAVQLLRTKESLSAATAAACTFASLVLTFGVLMDAIHSATTLFRTGLAYEHFERLLLALAFMLPGVYAMKELGLAEYSQRAGMLIALGAWTLMFALLAGFIGRWVGEGAWRRRGARLREGLDRRAGVGCRGSGEGDTRVC